MSNVELLLEMEQLEDGEGEEERPKARRRDGAPG